MPRLAKGVLVSFGITGDLAKQMTFRSLYRLEARGLLDCAIVGLGADAWTQERLRRRMREAIAARETIDEAVFARLAARVSYLHGDCGDPGLYERLAAVIGRRRPRLFYLQTPPSLFACVVEGLARAGLTEGARIVVEKPFGHDLASARALSHQLQRCVADEQLYRVDHFLGKLGLAELLYLRSANTVLKPVWNADHVGSVEITMAERFGVADRGRFYDAVGALRDVVVNHLLQLVAAIAMEEPGQGEDVGRSRHRVLAAVADADPARCVRGQYEGFRSIAGVAPSSSTETYAALELRIDNERWRGVPFRIRAGKRLPITQTEVRLVFRDVAPLTFLTPPRIPSANELVLRLDPRVGIRLVLEAHRADAPGPEPVTLDMEFADQGGEGPTPYEVLFEAAFAGDHALFTREDTVEESWRIVEPLLSSRRRVHVYRPGTWGPPAAERLAGRGGWHRPWTV